MSATHFVVESTLEAMGKAYVLAVMVQPGTDFRVGASSTLGGYPVEEWLELPRVHGPDGQLRHDLFAFCLKSPADRHHFAEGQQVALADE